MIKLLVNRIRMGKLTLEDVKKKYPQYYDAVVEALKNNA